MRTTINSDAEWCGRLSQAIRDVLAEVPLDHGVLRRLRNVLDDYEVNSGFPPPDAQLLAHVGHDMPLHFLKPGERLINGSVYYSERWLQDGLAEVPGAYRYVIFLNVAKTKMLTCWPQEDGTWKLEAASRPWTDGTWGPPEIEGFHGDVKQLERLARGRGLPVKELAL